MKIRRERVDILDEFLRSITSKNGEARGANQRIAAKGGASHRV